MIWDDKLKRWVWVGIAGGTLIGHGEPHVHYEYSTNPAASLTRQGVLSTNTTTYMSTNSGSW